MTALWLAALAAGLIAWLAALVGSLIEHREREAAKRRHPSSRGRAA